MTKECVAVAWELIDRLIKKGCLVTFEPVKGGIRCTIKSGGISAEHVAFDLLEAVRGAIDNLIDGDLFDWLGLRSVNYPD